jgi:hypothetical protein
MSKPRNWVVVFRRVKDEYPQCYGPYSRKQALRVRDQLMKGDEEIFDVYETTLAYL